MDNYLAGLLGAQIIQNITPGTGMTQMTQGQYLGRFFTSSGGYGVQAAVPDVSVGIGASSGLNFSGIMGSLSLGASIGGTIGSMFSSFISSDATSYVLEKQAEIMKINEGKQQLNVESALRAGESQVAKVTTQAGAVKAKQRTAMAANGVQLGVGSSAELLTSTDINKAQDVKAIQENALSAAWGYATKASEYSTMAGINSLASQYQKDTQISQTIGAGLEAVGKVADKWYYYNKGF